MDCTGLVFRATLTTTNSLSSSMSFESLFDGAVFVEAGTGLSHGKDCRLGGSLLLGLGGLLRHLAKEGNDVVRFLTTTVSVSSE